MKKIILALTLALALSTNAFAYTQNYVSKDISVKEDTKLTGSQAPVLTLDECNDFEGTGTTDFSLILNNAEWLYEGSDIIENGLNYTVMTANEMIITVDNDVYDAASSGISIPLYTKITGEGVISVKVNPMSAPVSESELIFAHCGYPDMDIKVSANDDLTSFDLSIKDDYPYQIVAGRIFELNLDNGFQFTGEADLSATGKFGNITEFSVDTNKRTAYIKIESTSGAGSGTIELKNVGIEPTSKSVTGDTKISIKAINNSDYSKSTVLGKYTADTSETDDNNQDGSEDNTDNEISNENTVKFTVGSDMYYVGSIPYKSETKSYINSSSRLMVPVRALSNAFGVDDNNIKWVENDTFRGVVIEDSNRLIKIPAMSGNNSYIEVNGVKVKTDAGAEIVNDRIYLPIRSMANAFGIADEAINWNQSTGEVIINMPTPMPSNL